MIINTYNRYFSNLQNLMMLIISHIVSAVSCNRQSKIRQSKIQGLRFKIKPPNSLTFLEQLNFLFTNTTLTFIIFNIHFPLHWFQSDVFRYSRYKYWIISWLYETYTWQCLTFSSLKSNISLVIEIFYNLFFPVFSTSQSFSYS